MVSKAKKIGLTTGEYMRRAAEGYRLADDDKALEAMIEEMNKATKSAELAIDDALAFVEESNKRIGIKNVIQGKHHGGATTDRTDLSQL